jgi:GDPmannose 4,6-dehydratase
MESISTATLNLLEVIRYLGGGIRFFNAGSSECFGQTGEEPATEETPLRPRSPYAVAKAAAYWQVATYREAYGMFACTGILANHESPLRPQRFVTQKIIAGVKAIKAGQARTIQLGNLDIWRDWGWAPEYVQAMVLMLQAEHPNDYLIASGTTTSLRDFAQAAFAAADLDLANHLESVEALMRPADLTYSAMEPARIAAQLGWRSQVPVREIVAKMYCGVLF